MKTEVLKFSAEWCKSCLRMTPIFKDVANEMADENTVFAEIDVESDEGVELSTKYQVRNVPTILIVKNNRVIDRVAGTMNKSQLKEFVGKWI